MPIRHRLGPEALICCMNSTSEEGSSIRCPFKNTLLAHREGQSSLILPGFSDFDGGFLSQEASVLVQRCELGTLGSGLGTSLTLRGTALGGSWGLTFWRELSA